MPKKQKPTLSPEEGMRLKQEKVEKEFQKKRLIIKYKKFVKVIGILLIITIIGLAIFYVVRKVQKPPLEQKAEQIIEKPPANFEIKTQQIKILPNGVNRYDVLVIVADDDLNWGVPRLEYNIMLENKDKLIVGERQGTTFILPDQKKSIIELGIETQGSVVDASVELKIKDVQKLTSPPELNLIAENLTYQTLDTKSKVNGTLANQTPFGLNEIIINILVYDKAGELQGLNYTTINDLSSNAKRDFSVLWRKQLSVKKPQIVVEPYVNPYNSAPFLDVYSEGQMLEY